MGAIYISSLLATPVVNLQNKFFGYVSEGALTFRAFFILSPLINRSMLILYLLM